MSLPFICIKYQRAIPFIFFCGLMLLGGASCKHQDDPKNGEKQPASHQKMIAILAGVAQQLNNPQNNYAADAKLAKCNAMLAANKNPVDQINLLSQKSNILLELGDEAEAVKIMEQLKVLLKSDPAGLKQVYPVLGMAYLRLAERNNCINNQSQESCIMPIQGKGVHQDKAPSRKAVNAFEMAMSLNPDDLDSRWLLNIAYMTLGEYPGKVPKAWLIPGLDNAGAVRVKPFSDMAGDLGIGVKNRGGGNIVEDFNNDGYLDIVSSAWGLDDPIHYYKNNGDGTFKDVSRASGLSAIMGGLNMIQADYNNDGWMDIFVLRGAWQGQTGFGEQPNSLLRNNGNGTFTDVTIDAGLLTYQPTQTGTWNDFNHDGWIDLFIGNESTNPNDLHPCEFFINNGDGTFDNISTQGSVFYISKFVKGVASGDYDNDGWVDIFLSCFSGEKILLRNKGIAGKVPAFEDVSAQAGFTGLNSRTFPTWFFDYDNDGWLDIFTCNYEFGRPLSYYAAKEALKPSSDMSGKIYLYHNNGNGTFTDKSPTMHVNQVCFAMGANFGDIDNDGFLDFYLSTGNPNFQSLVPNRLYKNMGGKDFADVSVSSRTANLQKGHAVSFADINNNGDQDISVDMGGAYRGDAFYSSLFLNPGQNNNNWICIKLEGTSSNRAAIGAKLALKFRENGVERTVYRDVNSGGSFGCSPLRREIGIGQATVIDEINVFWPASGIRQVLKNVHPNQFIQLKEGQEGFSTVPLKALVFKRIDGTIPMCANPALGQ
jgi:hypothetical protein